MTFYSNLATAATQLLTDKGQLLAFTRQTITKFEAAPGETTSSTSTFQGYGVTLSYNSNEIDGATIKRGDIRAILSPISIAPMVGDMVAVDGNTYRIMAVMPTSPAGTVVKYDLQLRR